MVEPKAFQDALLAYHARPCDAEAEAVRAAVLRWIPVSERLPEQREKPYQVIALCVKRYKEMCYAGEPIRGIYQDWVLRNWPQNYTHWMPFPALPYGVPMLDGQTFPPQTPMA